MLRRFINLSRRSKVDKRAAIMDAIRIATEEHGQCVIVGITPIGTRIIVLGKDVMTKQLEEISKEKEVQL